MAGYPQTLEDCVVVIKLLALPILALTLTGCGAVASGNAGETPDQIVARSGEITRSAGSARFVISYSGSEILSGAADLRNETAVLNRHDIFAVDSVFHPIPSKEAEVLGIAEKQWVETEWVETAVGQPSLISDPFISDLNGFFELLERADEVRFLGNGAERGTPVRRYAAKLGEDDFLALLPPTVQEQGKSGKTYDVQMREYFRDYFGWDEGGQSLKLAVDPQGRIRRAHLVLPLEPLTVQFYDYGVAVDVSPPPAKRVIAARDYESLKTEYCSNPIRQIRPRKPPCQ